MREIADWLGKLGLGQYAQRFAENDIDFTILVDLTDQDLEKIGISSLGHRRRILRAIVELGDVGKTTQGTPVSAEPTPPMRPRDTAERRQVTVMFSDLVGSTALSARMDPEDLREVISAYQKAVAATVQRFDGFVAKYMGDGVLVYFGYPQAHEDDSERAVRAGLELVVAIAKLNTHAVLQARVGIATGTVIVGDLIGAGSAQEQAIAGETPNLAARLQDIAEANTVVIAESTRKLLGNLFEFEDLGLRELKGIAVAVHAYAALRASSVESRFEALRTVSTPLVGRSEEIELLLRRWEQAKAGDGCVVLISGEPGIGKSRIAQTVLERIGGEPHTRLRFFCSPHHQDSALYPTITHIERAAAFRRDDTPEQRLDKIEALLAKATNDVRAVAPLFADLLSIPVGERYLALELTPQKRKEKTLAALTAQVEGLAARDPVLMVYEDAHWSDPTTRESLDLLIDRVPQHSILVIITFRPEFTSPWIGRPQVTTLTLNRLPSRQRAEMIAHVTGGQTLPKDIADQIAERTDGVPLFIEELTKSVVESGIVAEGGGSYAVSGQAPLLGIPTTLHASLLARLDRLAPTREAAQIGAAIGRSFSHELISAVGQMPQQKLDDALEQLVAAELIHRRGTPPDAEYTFKHALVQDAAYSILLRSRRQQIHASIAAALENKFPELVSAQPALMAQHCAQAGLVAKSISYWLAAGQISRRKSAMIEAVNQFRNGLDLLCKVPDTEVREQRELDLQIELGKALTAIRGWSAPECGATFARAHELCERLDRPQLLGSILEGEWSFHFVRGDLKLSERDAEEIRRLGEAQNDARLKLLGSSRTGFTFLAYGRFIDARKSFEDALALWNASDRTVIASEQRPGVLISLFKTLLFLGYIGQARVRRTEALAEARKQSSFSLVNTLCFSWHADWAMVDENSLKTMLLSADEILALGFEHGFPMATAVGKVMRGWCLVKLGGAAEVIPDLLLALKMCRDAECTGIVPFLLTRVAEVYWTAGQPELALNRLKEAIDLTEATQERWSEAEIYRLRGSVLLSMQKIGEAEESYQRAILVGRSQHSRFWEIRAATNLGRLWRDQGKRKEARELLAPVYGWFTEGFDTRDLKEAKALLGELSP